MTGPGVGSGARACMFRVHADVPTFGHLGEGVSVSHPVRAFVIKAVYTHTQLWASSRMGTRDLYDTWDAML